MMRRTIRFQGIKAREHYTCQCGSCGKTLRRVVTVEHTINPFNRNPDGTLRTASEVRANALVEAKRIAGEKQGGVVTCRNCERAAQRGIASEIVGGV